MRISLPRLSVRVVGVLALVALPVACSEQVTAPEPAAIAPPSASVGPLAPEAALRAVLPATAPQVYPVTVTVLLNEMVLGTFPAMFGSAGNDKGIVFFPTRSRTVRVTGGGVIAYTDGKARGQGGIVATIGQGPPNSNPMTLSIDFAQFNGVHDSPFVLAAGGIPGGGCIFATATGGDNAHFIVRLDYAPRSR